MSYHEKARQGQVDFHRRELEEGPTRKPPMPEQQLAIHRRELERHLGLQAVETECQVIPFPIREEPEDIVA